jgi:hypothetical protein
MPRLFALDHNFPQPIVDVLSEFQVEAELVRVDRIDSRMPDLDDWQLLLALHHHPRPWDGLITTDSSMLRQAREISVLIQTQLTLVVALASGHDPVKASGLLFAYLGGICKRTEPDKAQVWQLNAAERSADDAWHHVAPTHKQSAGHLAPVRRGSRDERHRARGAARVSEIGIEAGRGFVLRPGHEMTVAVECDRDARVAHVR